MYYVVWSWNRSFHSIFIVNCLIYSFTCIKIRHVPKFRLVSKDCIIFDISYEYIRIIIYILSWNKEKYEDTNTLIDIWCIITQIENLFYKYISFNILYIAFNEYLNILIKWKKRSVNLSTQHAYAKNLQKTIIKIYLWEIDIFQISSKRLILLCGYIKISK